MKPFKLPILIFFFSIATIMVKAQSLPGKQEPSVWLPATVKIDGKANEWGNKFQAYNRATDVFYTVANNDENLYVLIKASQPDVIKKIILVGFSIVFTGIDNKEALTVTYPVCNGNDKPSINVKNAPEITPSSSPSAIALADSFMNVYNIRLNNKVKYIKITRAGVDSLISVYNDGGLKAAGQLNNKMEYTCELALPLGFLGLSTTKNTKFKYDIIVHGIKLDDMPGVSRTIAPDGSMRVAIPKGTEIISSDNYASMFLPTDVSGEYTLAKKP